MKSSAIVMLLLALPFACAVYAQGTAAISAGDSAFNTAQAAAEKAVAEKGKADAERVTAEVEAFRRLAETATTTAATSAANAASSVETMKWIFGIASALITGIGGIVGGILYYVFSKRLDKLATDQAGTLEEFREKVKRIAAEESAQLATLARVFTAMMTVERFLEDTNKRMLEARRGLTKLKEEADQTTNDWKARRNTKQAEFDTYFKHAQQDFILLKKLDADRLELAGPEPRWTAYIAAEEGLLLHHAGHYEQAYEALKRAIAGTPGDDFASRSRRASYTFNASCGSVKRGDLGEAKKLLGDCLKLEPRYYLDLRDDEEWSTLLTDKDVIDMRDKAAVAYGPI